MTNTKYSISAASRIINKSRATIARHMAAGKLSFEIDADGNRRVEASELARVYGDQCRFDREEKRGRSNETPRSDSHSEEGGATVKQLQEQLLGQYISQVEHLQNALNKALDVTKLVEDRSADTSAWQKSLDALSVKIANETKTQLQTLQERHDKEIHQLKRALYNERKKSLWQKVFR